jgi:ribosomal protein L37AE/L43A
MAKCSFDPTKDIDKHALGMYHCPECGEMVMSNVPHPNYDLLNNPPKEESITLPLYLTNPQLLPQHVHERLRVLFICDNCTQHYPLREIQRTIPHICKHCGIHFSNIATIIPLVKGIENG